MNEAILNSQANKRRSCGDEGVVIYAGATILGPITIGRGSSIGNVWLTESVPPGSRITQARTQTNARGASI